MAIPGVRDSHVKAVIAIEKELDLNSDKMTSHEIGKSTGRIQFDETSDDVFLPMITLPDAEAEYLARCYRSSKTILEYGSGGSTVYAAALPDAPKVFSIESDKTWSVKLQDSINQKYPKSDICINYVNIGATGAWGRPKNHNAYLQYPNYAFGIYDDPNFVEPDLIFIDGRFRAACFYAALFRMSKPVTVLWDDYIGRKSYHVVEQYFKPVDVIGRMVRFEVSPISFPVDNILAIVQSIMDSN
jgi:hypothetical protein